MAKALPNGGGIGPFPQPPKPPTQKLGNPGSPGLLTSTGGLFGNGGLLLTPVVNITTENSYILLMDPSDFNCEEDAEYDYPQYIPQGHEGEIVTCHLIILKYREIGKANFNVNVFGYNRNTDTFDTVVIPVSIPIIPLTGARKATFPDNEIHTVFLYPPDGKAITVERPQVFSSSKGGSGAYSITSLTLCGNADEQKQQ